MLLKLNYIYVLLPTIMLKSIATIPVQSAGEFVEENLRVRVRRQDGYVYDKPSVSFDLPQRSTPAPTQAPNVDRTLTQTMYYAYPVPAGGDTVNIGQTSKSTATTATAGSSGTGGGGGYNYGSSGTGSAAGGYDYSSQTSGTQVNSGSQVSTGSQTTTTGSQTATNTGTSQSSSGYGNNVPSPTLSPTLQGSSDVSTSAPKYLPPTESGTSGGSATTGGSVSIGGVSINSGSGQGYAGTTSVQAGSVGTPSDKYLPPLGTSTSGASGTSIGGTVTGTTAGIQTNAGGSVSIPSASYLPPNSSAPSASPAGAPSPQPAPAPQTGYIPPARTNSGTGTVSTPASGYLPPSFF
ncbi:protein rtoA-like isoform X1 [Spodoptera frugiperda]|uniref:Protein rtoA-like isoform X1 n=1 Tax=Spodoptera frugiperda TaxID=7108 RepID=A0A9R0F4N8_SPOFR|nr:protein rtoA-like isoform X1 [Spodoptera frugiperda]